MVKKSFPEIVRGAVGVAAFAGLAVVLAGSISGNDHWYKNTYRKPFLVTLYRNLCEGWDISDAPLEKLSYEQLHEKMTALKKLEELNKR